MSATSWKEIRVDSTGQYERLESTINALGAKGYVTTFETAVQIIQTNMPYSLLRTWFSFAGVPLPSDIGISRPIEDTPTKPGVYHLED